MSTVEEALLRDVARIYRQVQRRLVWRARLHRALGWALCGLGGLAMHQLGVAVAVLRLLAPHAAFG
jgi:hypothetical protein